MSFPERTFCSAPGRSHGGRPQFGTGLKDVSETLATVAALLDRLVPTAEPAVAYKALADACVLVLADECRIEIIQDGRSPYRVTSHEGSSNSTATNRPSSVGTTAPRADDLRVTGRTARDLLHSGRSFVITDERVCLAITDVGVQGPDYFGSLVCTRRGRPAFALADAQVLRLVVERTVASIRRERAQQTCLQDANARCAELERALDASRELGVAVGGSVRT